MLIRGISPRFMDAEHSSSIIGGVVGIFGRFRGAVDEAVAQIPLADVLHLNSQLLHLLGDMASVKERARDAPPGLFLLLQTNNEILEAILHVIGDIADLLHPGPDHLAVVVSLLMRHHQERLHHFQLVTELYRKCAKLRIKPCLPRAILDLTIVDCDVLLSSWGESSSQSGASQVTQLYVTGSKLAISEWKLLHHLPALRELTIHSCSVLTASIKIIQHIESLRLKSLSPDQAELPSWLLQLKSLHELELNECKSMTFLPEWLGQLTSLKRFKIYYCDGIRSFPDSIQQLTKLEVLHIKVCPTLEQWCKTKENKMKLAHITEVFFGWKRYIYSDSNEEDGADESYEEDIASGERSEDLLIAGKHQRIQMKTT